MAGRRIAPLALLALVVAGPVLAQRADRPSLRAGDRWQFVEYHTVPSKTPNRAWTITSVTDTQVAGTENGEPLLLTADLNILDSPRSRYSNPEFLRFPLETGRTWRFATDWLFKGTGSSGTAEVEVAVLGYETLLVAGGSFAAFKLVSTARTRGKSPKGSLIDADIVTTYWYAPAARAIVKSVTRNPYIGVTTVELVEFAP